MAVLTRLESALAAGDSKSAANLFAPESYWRDLVAFTWNLKTLEGREQIKSMLAACLPSVKPRKWALAENEDVVENDGATEAWFTFETATGRGYGHMRLKADGIWTFLTTLVELKGHEERQGFTRPLGAMHGVNRNAKSWKEQREEEAATLGRSVQPYVPHRWRRTGRDRARRAAAPTRRAGDHRREERQARRFLAQSLQVALPARSRLVRPPALHRLPRQLAGVLAQGQDRRLARNVRQGDGAQLLGLDRRQTRELRRRQARVDVDLEQEGREITLRPKQLVFATGMSAKPNLPTFKGMATFRGEQHHSSQHPGPDACQGKRVVVIGSNNSAHDICAALWENGVDVTMVQRSSTNVVRSEPLMELGLGDLYSERAVRAGITTAKADLISASIPYRILHTFQKPVMDKIRALDAAFYAALEKAGFKLDFGEDKSGLTMKYMRRGSGYYIDIGAFATHHRRQDQTRLRPGRGGAARRGQAGQRPGDPRRRDRLRHRLRLDERFRRGHLRQGDGRQGRQGLGPRLGHHQGPRPLGGRAAQHVEADAAGGAVVPRRQPAPVAPLLAVSGAAAEGAPGRASRRRFMGCRRCITSSKRESRTTKATTRAKRPQTLRGN